MLIAVSRLVLLFTQSVVQVETLGEFGAVFIVFMAGLEFSPEKLKKVNDKFTSLRPKSFR